MTSVVVPGRGRNWQLRLFIAALLTGVLASGLVHADMLNAVVDRISVSSYSNYLNDRLYTHTGDNRGLNGAQHDLARQNIYNEFVAFGLNPTLQGFTYNSRTYYNVVATRQGRGNPDEIYIVGAHYDSANTPGADDNASGVAGVLEMARVLSQVETEATIVFIAFDREEQGLVGGYAYANANASANIRGMVSLDMIAYNPAGSHYNRAYVYGNTNPSSAWKTKLGSAVNRYSNGITAEVAGAVNQSDHYPFEVRGKPGALLIEHAVWSNPHYHRATDSVDTANYIDYVYATNMTRSVTGLFLEEARLITPEPGTVVVYGICLVALALYGRRRWRRS